MKKKNNKKKATPSEFSCRGGKLIDKPGVIRLNEAGLKLLAMAGKTIAEAEVMLRDSGLVTRRSKSVAREPSLVARKGRSKKRVTNHESRITGHSLNEVFKKDARLKAAWERGIFLKKIADFAATATTVAEAGIELQMQPGELEKIFATDTEAAEMWNQSRHNKRIEIKKAFMDKAVDKCSLNAIKQMDKLLGREIAHPAIDFAHINTEQMMNLMGKSRQTLQVDWPNKGLSRNADGTFNLFTFYNWLEDYITKTKSRKIEEANPAQDEKARKYRLQNDELEGRLLDRGKIITGLVARDQVSINIFAKYIEMEAEPYIKQKLKKILEDIRRELATKILDLKLNNKQAEQLKQLLLSLNPIPETSA